MGNVLYRSISNTPMGEPTMIADLIVGIFMLLWYVAQVCLMLPH